MKESTSSGRAAWSSLDSTSEEVVDALCVANDELLIDRPRRRGQVVLPSREAIALIVDDLRAVLFPGHFGVAAPTAAGLRHLVGARLARARASLADQVWRGLSFTCDHVDADAAADDCVVCTHGSVQIAAELVMELPRIRARLATDLRAAYDGDPAAKFLDETLFCYPGVVAITAYRIAHELYRRAVPLIPRIITDLAHSATGIDIHPGAEIGDSFFIDHGTGVVIGETCSIGNRVRLYQGVTLGARGFPSDDSGYPVKGIPRHPVVEDGVVIYAGATILGRITIGEGATIGGNVWLTRSVPSGTRLSQVQARNDGRREDTSGDNVAGGERG